MVRRRDLLTVEEEQALARRVHGDDAEDAELAVRELVERNLGLLRAVASRMSRRAGMEVADMAQAGYFGLARAARRYRPGAVPFAGYACLCIRTAILCEAYESHLLYVPEGVLRALAQARAGKPVASKLTSLLDDAKRAIGCLQDGGEILDKIAVLDESSDELPPEHARVWAAMGRLAARDAYVLCQRIVRERTLTEVADVFGVGKERIRQIQDRAADRFREAMKEVEGGH